MGVLGGWVVDLSVLVTWGRFTELPLARCQGCISKGWPLDPSAGMCISPAGKMLQITVLCVTMVVEIMADLILVLLNCICIFLALALEAFKPLSYVVCVYIGLFFRIFFLNLWCFFGSSHAIGSVWIWTCITNPLTLSVYVRILHRLIAVRSHGSTLVLCKDDHDHAFCSPRLFSELIFLPCSSSVLLCIYFRE